MRLIAGYPLRRVRRMAFPKSGSQVHLGGTLRADAWWIGPAITVFVYTSFIAYTTWAIFQASHYYAEPYLSPFYSPVLFTKLDVPGAAPLDHAWFGEWPAWWPDLPLLPASPALLVLAFPALYRFTCYYYRKGYYRSFVGSPPACAVSPGARARYRGETRFLLFQNLHRYTTYAALLICAILTYDAVLAFFKDGAFGVGVGSIVLTLNAVLIACYVLGCHSLRHLLGGRLDCMSCGRSRFHYRAWKSASWFSGRHALFAWLSLFSVSLADVYVRLVSAGVIADINTWT
jgi:hypothetical protein